jgi:hypothetical protein
MNGGMVVGGGDMIVLGLLVGGDLLVSGWLVDE